MVSVTVENSETGEKNVYTGDYALGCTGSVDKVFGLASGSIFAEGVPEKDALEILDIFYKEMKKAIRGQMKNHR